MSYLPAFFTALIAGTLTLAYPSIGSASDGIDDIDLMYIGVALNPTPLSTPDDLGFIPSIELGIAGPFDLSLSLTSSSDTVDGDQQYYELAPGAGYHVELNLKQTFILQAYASLRVPLQLRSDDSALAMGIAGTVEAGARFWICPGQELAGLCGGIGVAVRHQQNLSRAQLGSSVMSAGSSHLSTPIMLSFGFNPHS